MHRPIDLAPVLAHAGAPPFRGRTAAHVDYFFGREIERWAEWRAVPVIGHRPTHHDNPLDLAHGMLIAAQNRGADVDALAHAILEAHWRDDADHADPATLARVARAAGIDPEPLLEQALSPEIQAIHRRFTDEAKALNLFGSPTYSVQGDLFYGQDRLEFVARALERPFAPHRWSNPRPGN